MKQQIILLFSFLFSLGLFAQGTVQTKDSIVWRLLANKEYTLHYTDADLDQVKKIDAYLASGINYIDPLFQHSFINKFDVYVFPDREEMDKQWQKDWNDPTFKSECWMIASGVAHRLDILSPNAWKKESCEHDANDTAEVRKVILHELVHVFHGQWNADHTFSNIEKLDWLIEGVATFVSGQLDEKRLQRTKQLINEDKTPATLDNFWKGQEKYGLSGSMVAFIDNKYGRKKLFELLRQTNKDVVLKLLGISEIQLLADWEKSFD